MNKTRVATAILLSGLITTNIFATNGYFSHGYGAKEKGMAGAGVAKGGSSISSANNPANLLQVGDSLDFGVSFFNPQRSYTVTGEPALPANTPIVGDSTNFNCGDGMSQLAAPTCQIPFSYTPETIDSESEWFLIPSMGYSSRIDERSVWGISVYGNGGMNTDYETGSARLYNPESNTVVDAPGTYGSGHAGVNMMQLFINTSYAYQVNKTVGIGASFIVAVHAFEAVGIAPFANNSSNPEKLTNNDHDISTGFAVKLGMNAELSEAVTLGLSYQSKFDMTEFDDYAGLFAEGGDFDIPSTYTLGLAIKTSATSSLLFDYQKINYGEVASIANSISPLLSPLTCTDALNNSLMSGAPAPATGSGCLGGANGAGFGWDDVTVYKIGYEWAVGKDTWRVGFSTTEQPISSTELNFNILAPGVVEDHYTAGYTSNSGDNEWTAFLMYAPEVKISGPSMFDQGHPSFGTSGQVITIRMNQLEVGFEYNF
ncbi:MAG: hypothetical protein GY808_13345 [Gammaproteobacteria bacterium]|nr:hypothetical protein [Gammaproteobacteria bacterium]